MASLIKIHVPARWAGGQIKAYDTWKTLVPAYYPQADIPAFGENPEVFKNFGPVALPEFAVRRIAGGNCFVVEYTAASAGIVYTVVDTLFDTPGAPPTLQGQVNSGRQFERFLTLEAGGHELLLKMEALGIDQKAKNISIYSAEERK